MTAIEQRRTSFDVQFVKTTEGDWYLEVCDRPGTEIYLGPFPVEVVLLVEDSQLPGDEPRGKAAGTRQ